MDWIMVAGAAVGVAVWWWPQPRRHVAQLRGRPEGLRGRGWWRGRAGTSGRTRVLAGGSAAAVALLLIDGWLGWALAALASAGAMAAVGHLVPRATRLREQSVARELPVALDLLAAMVASGAPLRRAVSEVARVSPPTTAEVLSLVAAHTDIGVNDEQAWRVLLGRNDWAQGWVPVARDLARGAASGTGMEATLHTHASDARRRRQESLELRARTVGVRSVMPLMVCFLPAFLLVGVVPIIAGTVLRALS